MKSLDHCSSCFEQGLPTTHCRITLGHSGPGVYWMTAGLEQQEKVPQCYHSLHSISFTTHETNVLVDPTATIAHLGPQCPQDYGQGFLVHYTNKKWDEWRKSLEHQSGSVLKLCTRPNTNNGVMRIGTKVYQYTVSWRQHYTCY